MANLSKDGTRFSELELRLNPRPRLRSRLATGRSKLHTRAVIASDPAHEPEPPVVLPEQ